MDITHEKPQVVDPNNEGFSRLAREKYTNDNINWLSQPNQK
jgi:hypothetical protein